MASAATTRAPSWCETNPAALPIQAGIAGPSEALLKIVVLDERQRRLLARRKHLALLLEANARAPLGALAEELGAAVSTVHADLHALKQQYAFVLLSRGIPEPSLAGLPEGWQRIQLRRRERRDRVVATLRQDARATLKRLSRQLGIPASTLAEDMADITKRFTFSVKAKGGMAGTGGTLAGEDAP